MKLAIDRYAYLDSVIHHWEQRSKLIALLGLIFAFAFVEHLILLPAMIVITATFFYLSRLPFSFLLSRLRYPGWFILGVVIFLPFVAGNTVLFRLGFLDIKQEGCLQVLLIVTRFLCILTISLILFGTAPFLTSIKAMRSLGLPHTIVDMMLLSYRYLEELGGILQTRQRAMKMRGFQNKSFSFRNLKILAGLTGSLLVSSYEKSKRVYQAMLLRGYGQKPLPTSKLNSLFGQHKIAFIVTLLLALSFVSTEIILSLFK